MPPWLVPQRWNPTTNMLELLKRYFGYDEFRPLQAEIVDAVMDRTDTLVVMPTGGGKSLCFQLPSLALPGVTLVVSPLIALMKDQVDALKANGIAAECLNSGMGGEEQSQVQMKAYRGDLKLLYVAPERIVQPGFQRFLKSVNLSLIAVDEAHCISQWEARVQTRLSQSEAAQASRARNSRHRAYCYRHPTCAGRHRRTAWYEVRVRVHWKHKSPQSQVRRLPKYKQVRHLD